MQTWQIILITFGSALLVGSSIYAMTTMSKKTTLTYSQEVIQGFVAFNKKYGKSYSDPDFFAYRLGVYDSNAKKIASHNAKKSTYTMALNQFADLTHDEFVKTYLGLQQKKTSSPYGFYVKSNETPANSVDWRDKGAVSQVKDQGQCGSCWAFSTTGSLESDSAIEAGSLGNYSEQQLVDCSSSYGNMGCDGGLMDQAFQYVIDNGITSEDNYPYTAETDSCNDAATKDIAYQISSFKDIPSGDCDSLTSAVNQQPVAIGVDAESWQFYSGGVFSDCGDQLDHGVLAVGYDDSSNWIVKNSWGTGWGESGYITLATGNTCGICNTASIPQK